MLVNQDPSMPNQMVAEQKWTEDYYKRTALFLLQNFYTIEWDVFGGGLSDRYREMFDAYRTYFGKQLGNDYMFIREPVPNLGSTAQYVPGRIATSIMNWQINSIVQIVKDLESVLYVKSLSDNMSEREFYLNALDMMERSEDFAELINGIGIKFNGIPPNVERLAVDQQRKWLQTTFRENSEEVAYYLGRGAMQANMSRKVFKEQATHTIIGGLVGIDMSDMHVWPYPSWKTINPFNLIYDRRFDDELGVYDTYRGLNDWMDVNTAIAKYNLDKDKADYLRSIANSPGTWSTFSTLMPPEINVWQAGVGSGNPTVMVSKIYWYSYKDTRYKGVKKPDSYGNYHVKKLDPRSGKSGAFTPTIRYCVIIGNCVIAEYGECTNLTINSASGLPELPILRFQPSPIWGQNVSVGNLLTKYQQQLDICDYKLAEHEANDFGMITRLDPAYYPEGHNRASILSDLKHNRVVEMNSHQSGFGENKNPIDGFMLGLPSEVSYYLAKKKEIEREMRIATGTSEMMQGLLTGVIGKGVMEQMMASNSINNLGLADGILMHFQNILNYSINKSRMNIAGDAPNEKEMRIGLPLSVGDVKVIKATPDDLFQKMNIALRIDDLQGVQRKQFLMMIADKLANANAIDPDAIIKMMNRQTSSEIEAIIEDAVARKREEMHNMMAAQQAAQAMTTERRQQSMDNSNSAMVQAAKINQETQLTKEAMRNIQQENLETNEQPIVE